MSGKINSRIIDGDGHIQEDEDGIIQHMDAPYAKVIRKMIDQGRIYLGIETEELTMPFAIKTVGNKPFFYSSDFPHEVTNASCKHDIAELLESTELTEDDKAALLYANSERFYQPHQ